MLGQHSNQIWKHQVKKSGAFPAPTIRNQDVICHDLVVYLRWDLPVNTGHAKIFYGPSNVGPWTLGGEEDNYDTTDFIVGATTTALPGDTIYYYVHWTSGLHSGDTAIQGPFVDGACPFPTPLSDDAFADCTDVLTNWTWFDGINPVIATGATYELFISTAGAGGPFTGQGSGAYDDSGHIQGYGDGTSLPPNTTIWFKLKIVYGTQIIESLVLSIFNGPC
jgi:hypothetical protein